MSDYYGSVIDKEEWLMPLWAILFFGFITFLCVSGGAQTAALFFGVTGYGSFYYFANRLEEKMAKAELRRANAR